MELISVLGELAQAPGPEQARIARVLNLPGEVTRAAYTDSFVVKLYPRASVYLSSNGQAGGEVLERIESFWRTAKQVVPDNSDHISTLLYSYGALVARAGATHGSVLHDITSHLRHAFLWEYLLSWCLPFLLRVRELGAPVYRAWSTLALDALEAEATAVGLPAVLPLYLRTAPPLPQSDQPALLSDALFAPVCSGIILTRSDLARCAHDLSLNVQVTDRRYTLKWLLAHDLPRTSAWLTAEARRQHASLQHLAGAFGFVVQHWLERAQQTALRVSELAIRYAGKKLPSDKLDSRNAF